jgi:1,6-anhydro-N-acetylmuramate kinase
MGKAEELAAAIQVLERGKRKRRKYPADLRQRCVDYVREQRAAGAQLKSVADRLGVSATLLHRWEMKRGARFRRVELKAAAMTASRCVLHAPHGVRVEGLGLDELVAVLQRLG